MQNHHFKAPPHLQVEPLPFAPNKPAFTDWLNRLPFNDSFVACQKLYNVLMAPDVDNWSPSLAFAFLHAVVPVVDNLSQRLEYVYLDSGFPLTEQETATVELVGWTYGHLAGRFSGLFQRLIAEGDVWTVHDKAATLYRTFYSAGRLQLCASVIYRRVPAGFWREVYWNYRKAEQHSLSVKPIKLEGLEPFRLDTLFKQLLIIDRCDTHCFRPREIKNLHHLLLKFSGLAIITDKPIDKPEAGLFKFDLDSDQNPEHWKPGMPASARLTRFIDVLPAMKKIYHSVQAANRDHNTLQSVNHALLLKAVGLLSKGRKRKYRRFSVQSKADGLIGFDNVIGMIANIQGKTADELIPVLSYDPRIAGRWKQPDFDLVPLGEEHEYQLKQKLRERGLKDKSSLSVLQANDKRQSPFSDLLYSTDDERNQLMEQITVDHFDIFNSSLKGYGMLCKPGAKKVKIGEIFGIEQDQGKRLEIGLVSRITVQTASTLCLGMELIGLESDVVWLVQERINKKQGMLAIYIRSTPALKQSDSVVVVGSSRLQSGQAIIIRKDAREISCKLGAHLHSTPAVDHFELVGRETSDTVDEAKNN